MDFPIWHFLIKLHSGSYAATFLSGIVRQASGWWDVDGVGGVHTVGVLQVTVYVGTYLYMVFNILPKHWVY